MNHRDNKEKFAAIKTELDRLIKDLEDICQQAKEIEKVLKQQMASLRRSRKQVDGQVEVLRELESLVDSVIEAINVPLRQVTIDGFVRN